MKSLKLFIVLPLCFMVKHVSVSADESGSTIRLDLSVIKKFEEKIRVLERKVDLQADINREQSNLIAQLNGKIDSLEKELVTLESTQVLADHEYHSSSRDHASATTFNQTYTSHEPGSNAKTGVSSLRRGVVIQSDVVAFTAYLDHSISNLGIDRPIVYNKVLLNQGNGYNTNTGIFTCPFDGIYIFNFMVSTHSAQQIVAKLVVDNVNQVDGVSDTSHLNQEAQGGNYAILSLTQGQNVWVANFRWDTHGDTSSNGYRFSTFSGHVLA